MATDIYDYKKRLALFERRLDRLNLHKQNKAKMAELVLKVAGCGAPYGNGAKVDAQKKYIGRRVYVIIIKKD